MRVVQTLVVMWLATILVMAVFTVAIVLRIGDIEDKLEVANIAGTRVPPVSCQEDEVIWWVGVDRLGCVHFEEVR